MNKAIVLILFSLLVFPTVLKAQSGRNRPTATKPGTETKTDKTDKPDKSDKGDDTENTFTESKITPGGETVEGDVIRTDTSLVMVPVSVLDRNGRYIPILRRENFRIMENGVEQKISYFATTDSPFTVVLLIDTSGSTHFKLDEIQDAAITFVSKLKDNDSVMVMSFDDRIDVQCKATTDRNEIEHAIRRTRTGGGTRLYDAVENVFKKQLDTIPGRKAVVLFTDGVDTTSRRGTYDNTIRLAAESDAPIYSVDYDTSGMFGGGGGLPIPGGRGTVIGLPFPMPGRMPGTTRGSTEPEYRHRERQ